MNRYVEARELTRELDLRISSRIRLKLLPELRTAVAAVRKARADMIRLDGERLLVEFEIEQLEKLIRGGGS